MKLGRLAAVLALVSSCFTAGCAGAEVHLSAPVVAPPQAELADLARRAVSADPTVRAQAIASLRAAGPAGLDALFATWPGGVEALLNGQPSADPDAARLRDAIDRVARQRDGYASRLYWYTDLDEAVRAARAAHKPILSLRLLGNLDEELSCANSRFFRTMLYPDPTVAAALRDRFVLHWKSERPVPRITIDFGDGRRMERTITGNSIHYVLDEEGRPVDALPGLYAPRAFLKALTPARAVAMAARGMNGRARSAYLADYHVRAQQWLADEWNAELAQMGAPPALQPGSITGGGPNPSAATAVPIAVAKAAVEAPMVGAMQGRMPALPRPTDDAIWAALVARHAAEARLGPESRALMRRKIAVELDASGLSLAPLDEATFAKRLAVFEKTLAEEGVRNEHALHRTLHEWMAKDAFEDMEALDVRVYGSLFLTPRSDPWLGLLARDAYSGIENEGLMINAMAPAARRAP